MSSMIASKYFLIVMIAFFSPARADYEDTELTTQVYQAVTAGNREVLQAMLTKFPGFIHARSADGRGALWWAYEAFNMHKDQTYMDLVDWLISEGADPDATDLDGTTPRDMLDREAGAATEHVKNREAENKEKWARYRAATQDDESDENFVDADEDYDEDELFDEEDFKEEL
eukprot:157555_1